MRSAIIYILPALLFLSLSACYKDKGNYEYAEVNEIFVGKIAEKYTRMQGEYLEILPELGFTDPQAMDSARYTYEWIAMKSTTVVEEIRRDLANTKNLRYTVALPAGKYRVYYRLKDKVTDLQFQKSFDLEVTTEIYEGWMAMTDVNGKARLAMVNKLGDKYSVIPDVLGFVGSALELKGKPVGVNCMRIAVGTSGYAIYVSTDQTTDRIDPETFQYKSTFNIKYEMLSNIPETFAPSLFANAGFYRVFMVEGTDVYHYNYTMNIKFGLPINILRGEAYTFQIAPHVATSTRTEATCVYDNTNKRFVRHLGTESTCSLMPDGTLFNFQTGMDLVWMNYTEYNGGNVMAFLKEPGTGKYHFARFVFTNTVSQIAFEDVTAKTAEIAQAKNFVVHPDFGYVFYTVGGKLYSMDLSTQVSKLMLDKGAEEFTALTIRNSELVAASYDPGKPADSNGKLEVYTVPAIQDALVLKHSWPGMARIVGLSYRVR